MFVFKMALVEMLSASLWLTCYRREPALTRSTERYKHPPGEAQYQTGTRSLRQCMCYLSSLGAPWEHHPALPCMGTRNALREPPSRSSQCSCSASYLRQGGTGRRHTTSGHCWDFLPHKSLFHPQHICNNEDLLKNVCVCVKAVCKDPCFHSFVTSTVTHNISSLSPSQKAYVFFSFLYNSIFSFQKAEKNHTGQGRRQMVLLSLHGHMLC